MTVPSRYTEMTYEFVTSSWLLFMGLGFVLFGSLAIAVIFFRKG